jgi:hypothetical protein
MAAADETVHHGSSSECATTQSAAGTPLLQCSGRSSGGPAASGGGICPGYPVSGLGYAAQQCHRRPRSKLVHRRRDDQQEGRKYHHLAKFDLAAIDAAGTYTLTATAPAIPQEGVPGVTGSAVSAKFTVTPDTATDHLVFAPAFAFAGFPTSLSVSVEDQFGNIDTNVSNVQLNLVAIPGTTSTATLVNGQATFNNVIFTSAGQDFVLVYGSGGPNGFLFGDEFLPVVALTNGG